MFEKDRLKQGESCNLGEYAIEVILLIFIYFGGQHFLIVFKVSTSHIL